MFYCVLLGYIGFQGFCYWVSLGFNGFYWVLLGFTGFQGVLMGFTELEIKWKYSIVFFSIFFFN